MLPPSRSPTRSNYTSKQFRLRLKADYKDITERVRLVEFGFVATLIKIGPDGRIDHEDRLIRSESMVDRDPRALGARIR